MPDPIWEITLIAVLLKFIVRTLLLILENHDS